MQNKRRTFLRQMSALSLGALSIPLFADKAIARVGRYQKQISSQTPLEIAQDEKFWDVVREAYAPGHDFINLDNGYYCPTPANTMHAWLDHHNEVNREAARFMRQELKRSRHQARQKLTEIAGCPIEEVVLTRNTTESLDLVLAGMDLKPGDEIITSQYDYGSMVAAIDQQVKRFGIVRKEINLPPAAKSKEELVEPFKKAIGPKTRVLLVTHMINITGQILPAKEICDMAHARGVEVILDGAHTFAHIDFKIPDTGCDYFGTSLHKWLCAPLGTGLLYLKKEKISKIWPLFGDDLYPVDDIRKFEHIGTHPPGTTLTVGNAVDFHQSIGSKNKEERLRYLKNYWASEVVKIPGIKLNSPLIPELSCGIANVAIEGKDPNEMVSYLWDNYKIFTVAIYNKGVEGLRITPNLYTRLEELDLLIEALSKLSKN